jgi:hypothetical protein
VGWQVWHGFPPFAAFGDTKPVPEIQQPATQLAGLPLQTSSAGQAAFSPSVLVHDDVLVPGWQLSHGSLAFTAPDATTPVPAMSHCVPHTPLSQILPPPQLVPEATFVHDDVLEAGVQTSQPLFAVAPEL